MAARLVHLWEPSGTIACKGLTLASVARPLPEAPQITPYLSEVTCETCLLAYASTAAA
jgi:hypothetical protein